MGDLAGPRFAVKVPTRPAAPIKTNDKFQPIDLGPCKLIGTVMLARKERDRLFPLCGESLTLDWPPAATGDLVFQGEYGGMSYTVTLDLREFVCWGAAGEIQTRNGVHTVMKGLTHSGTSGGMNLKLDHLETLAFTYGIGEFGYAPLSVMPLADSTDLRLLVHLTRADRDDPLEEMPVADWLAAHAGEPQQDQPPVMNSYPGVRFDPDVPPGIRMLAFLGPAAFLLGMAAMAGSVVFRRGWRMPAFAGLLALMVLYAGLLDALVLQRRANVASDPKEPEPVRTMALAGMVRGTFFHRGTAEQEAREIAAHPATLEARPQTEK